MGKKPREKKLFRMSKGKVTTDNLTPMKGVPNTNFDTREIATGKLHSRRKYGNDGWAVKDLDVADKHNTNDHTHDISGYDRSRDRPLTKKERRELNKAKKKKRYIRKKEND